MSVILCRNALRFDTSVLTTVFSAVLVCEAIEAVSDKYPRMKWVNDIYLDDKKVRCFLTEVPQLHEIN